MSKNILNEVMSRYMNEFSLGYKIQKIYHPKSDIHNDVDELIDELITPVEIQIQENIKPSN